MREVWVDPWELREGRVGDPVGGAIGCTGGLLCEFIEVPKVFQ